jgi:hypothetical protein
MAVSFKNLKIFRQDGGRLPAGKHPLSHLKGSRNLAPYEKK